MLRLLGLEVLLLGVLLSVVGVSSLLTAVLRRLLSILLRLLAIPRLPSILLRRSAMRSAISGLLSWRTWLRAACHAALLIFGVVAWIDGAKDEFDHPEVRREVHRRLGFGHFR